MIRRLTVLSLAFGLLAAAPAPADYPVERSFLRAMTEGLKDPDSPPPGANRWDCRLTPAHPRPVILVHATALPPSINWRGLAPFLANRGFCVFTPVYGRVHGWPGMGRYEDSAADLAHYVDRVLANYPGLDKVDLAGHSQGGAMPRWYIKFLGGTAKVHRQVSIAGPNRDGTDFLGIMKLVKRWNALGLVRAVGDLRVGDVHRQPAGGAQHVGDVAEGLPGHGAGAERRGERPVARGGVPGERVTRGGAGGGHARETNNPQ